MPNPTTMKKPDKKKDEKARAARMKALVQFREMREAQQPKEIVYTSDLVFDLTEKAYQKGVAKGRAVEKAEQARKPKMSWTGTGPMPTYMPVKMADETSS